MNGPVYSEILGDVLIGNSDLADSCAWAPTNQAQPGARDLPIYPVQADLPPPPPVRTGPQSLWPDTAPEGLTPDQRANLDRSFNRIFGRIPGADR